METESSLAIDKKKIPIAHELRGLALELSGYLVKFSINRTTTDRCAIHAGEGSNGHINCMMEGLRQCSDVICSSILCEVYLKERQLRIAEFLTFM